LPLLLPCPGGFLTMKTINNEQFQSVFQEAHAKLRVEGVQHATIAIYSNNVKGEPSRVGVWIHGGGKDPVPFLKCALEAIQQALDKAPDITKEGFAE